MKKLALFTAILCFTFSSEVLAKSVEDYSEVSRSNAAISYKHNSKDIYAIVVDPSKAIIRFGGRIDYSDKKSPFVRGSITKHWRTNSNSKTIAALSGQYFNVKSQTDYLRSTEVPLSYPVKSNNQILADTVTDKRFKLRSILINKRGEVYIKDGFKEPLLKSHMIREYITGLFPAAVKDPKSKTGRHYIGGIPESNCDPNRNSCTYKKLIFLIGEKETHNDMVRHLIRNFGAHGKSIVMMDGSGSAKMYLKTNSKNIVFNGSDPRTIPNSIIIHNK